MPHWHWAALAGQQTWGNCAWTSSGGLVPCPRSSARLVLVLCPKKMKWLDFSEDNDRFQWKTFRRCAVLLLLLLLITLQVRPMGPVGSKIQADGWREMRHCLWGQVLCVDTAKRKWRPSSSSYWWILHTFGPSWFQRDLWVLVHIKSQVHLPSLGKDSLDGSRRMWEMSSLGNGHMRTVVRVWHWRDLNPFSCIQG